MEERTDALESKVSNNSKVKGLLMLAVMWCAYVTFAMNWVGGSDLGAQIVQTFFGGPVAPVIQQVVNYTITAARVVANLFAAYILIKSGPKRAITIAMVLLMFSVVAVWMPNYWAFTISRMVMALGGSMVIVYMNPVVANYVAPDKKMIANALNTVSYNVGAFVVSILFVFFAQQLAANWKITLTIMASLTVVFFILWLIVSEDFDTTKNLESSEEQVKYGYKEALRDSFVWKYSIAFGGFLFLYVLAVTSFPSVISTYAPKIDGSLLNLLVTGFAIVGTGVGMKLGLTDMKRKKILLSTGTLMIAMFALALIFANISTFATYAFAAISGFFMFIQYPVYMNLPHEMPNMSAQKLTVIFGLFWAIAYTVNTLFTFIWSMLLGNSGWLAASIFYIVGSCLYLVMAAMLPETK
ncbi:MFS transporter [Companilactobacillus mishanensis]|uniref:MFS transporter n=1 Tax=Companilactobacillus mishanensis TaxID=2486008 RepID=A0A5P0ZIH1_9LACO|nr:MFS transporter [Companilactobacillus mishanensis]MQS52869.1 MFS transporter [Companilactobacillus mishanensis]